MEKHICPWYFGYVLASPLRRLYQNPEKILSPYLKSDMKILEVGPGMGFFSLPMARKVGDHGRIYCIDLQEKMLQSLQRRALKSKLQGRIETRLCTENSLQIDDLAGSIDFALAFAVVHEVSDQHQLFAGIAHSLKKDGLLLISEPKGHVTEEEFERSLSQAYQEGLNLKKRPEIRGSHSAVLGKN
jgi:ubiquinone/menaquinone biosynthesis C-methylase UbiE